MGSALLLMTDLFHQLPGPTKDNGMNKHTCLSTLMLSSSYYTMSMLPPAMLHLIDKHMRMHTAGVFMLLSVVPRVTSTAA